MKTLPVAVLFLSVTAGSLAVYTGSFSTQSGSTCKWSEKVLEGDMRALAIQCQCQDTRGGRLQYSCEYRGNPHVCSMFSVQGGQERFYHHLSHHFIGMKQTISSVCNIR